MNKKQFYTACIVALVLSFGTFFGLNTVFPYHPEEIKVGETAELADVLAGTLSPAEPDGTPTNIGTTEELKAPPAAEPAAESAAADTVIEPSTADAAAPEPDAAAAEVAAEPAAATPAPEPTPAVVAAPEPKPAAKPADKPAAPKATAKAEPVKPWWSGDLDGELSVVYVGSLAEKPAIVVMFNGAFANADSLNRYGKVSGGAGKTSGSWELSAKNKRMAIFAVPKAGRYQLSLTSGLADGSGKVLKKVQQGPVDVK